MNEIYRIRFATMAFVIFLTSINVKFARSQDSYSVAMQIAAAFENQQECLVDYLKNEGRCIEATRRSQQGKGRAIIDKSLVVFHEDGYGLMMSKRNQLLTLSLLNPQYSASLSLGGKSTASIANPRDLSSISMRLDSINGPSTTWLGRQGPNEMIGLYFEFGGARFRDGFNSWRENDGTAAIENSSRHSNLKQITFLGWPKSQKCIYHYDPIDFVVKEIDGEYDGGTHGLYSVTEFRELEGVRIPVKSELKSTNGNASTTIEYSWEESSLTAIGFDPQQLYTSYYGLPEPDLTFVPPAQTSSWIKWIAATAFLLLVVFIGVRRYAS